MIIYVDLILLLNFIIDLLLLIGILVFLKRKCKFYRLLFSSLFGSLSTLFLFVISNNFVLIIYKFLISIIMILISFGYRSYHYFKDNLIYLYILSIILGGTMYLFNNTITLYNKAFIFQDNGLKINIYILILMAPFILYKYIIKEKHYRNEYQNYYNVEIYYNNYVIKETGFLDTGNNLKDPYFNKPIILINEDLLKTKVKTFLVPYYTCNNKDILEVFTPTKVVVNKKKTKSLLVGLSDINFNGVKIILNKEIL